MPGYARKPDQLSAHANLAERVRRLETTRPRPAIQHHWIMSGLIDTATVIPPMIIPWPDSFVRGVLVRADSDIEGTVVTGHFLRRPDYGTGASERFPDSDTGWSTGDPIYAPNWQGGFAARIDDWDTLWPVITAAGEDAQNLTITILLTYGEEV